MTQPVFSIITPMYKGASLVAATIKSVIAQEFPDWEMIIVDDCSPDNGEGIAVVNSFAQNDSRIKLIPLSQNRGSSGARNEALRNVCGRYWAFLDSDDIWHPDYLKIMKNHIDSCSDKQAAVFYCGYRRMDELCKQELLPAYICAGIKTYHTLLYHCPIFPSAAIVDSTKLKHPVFFREELRNLRDDYVFWLDILTQELVAVGYDDILVDYRMRNDSLTASKKKMIYPQWNIYRNVLKMNIFKSFFYLCSWALNGIRKYKKI